jgi:hypothetical protein
MITEKMEGGILVMRYKGQRIDPEKKEEEKREERERKN